MMRVEVLAIVTAGLSNWMKKMTQEEKDQTADLLQDYQKQFLDIKIPAKAVGKWIDGWLNHVYSSEDASKISCKKGCYYCCRIEAITCQYEVDRINKYIKRYNIEPIKNQKDNRCPFLNADNICNIYPVRPASCRKYIVITPRELCNSLDPKNNDAKIGVISDVNIEILVTGLWQSSKTMDIREAFK